MKNKIKLKTNNMRHINLSDIDPKEVYRVNLELAEERLKRETNPVWQSMIRKQIRSLKFKLQFDAVGFLNDNPEILN